jgi:hypothetical protein
MRVTLAIGASAASCDRAGAFAIDGEASRAPRRLFPLNDDPADGETSPRRASTGFCTLNAPAADLNVSPLSPPRRRRATSLEETRAARAPRPAPRPPTASVRAGHAKKVEGGSRGDDDQR